MDSHGLDSPLPIRSSESRSVSACSPLDSHTPVNVTMCDVSRTLRAGAGAPKHESDWTSLVLSCAVDSPAKTSPLPENAPDSPGNGPVSSLKSSGLRKRSNRRGDSLKMSQGSLALGGGEIWPRSLKDFGNAGLWSATQCWTANISESRNAADACSLSAVLQNQVLSKYFLSPKAAAGILRRATKRGRTLPPALEAALRSLASIHRDEAGKTT